jgi:hypothetical protein
VARLHLAELEDQEWLPALLRDLATDVLQFNQTVIDQVAPIVPKLALLLQTTRAERVVDLCSGASGPLLKLSEHLHELGHAVPIVMTDKFPNHGSFERVKHESDGRIDFLPESVDATDVPTSLTGVRTLFNGFHHLRPELARGVLADAVKDRQPIAIFEFVQRSPIAILGVVLAALLILPLTIPFYRPFRFSRIFFTYLVPLLPLFVLWDGVVSCLRVYSPAELQALCDQLPDNDYQWDIGLLKSSAGPVKITYLVGAPG